VHETPTILLVTLPSIHRFKKKFTKRHSDKLFFICLLTTPPHLKYVATLPCSLSLITCFLTLMFHNVVWQHMQGVLGFLITTVLQIYKEIFQWIKSENRLRFNRIIATSLWPHFFGPPVMYVGSLRDATRICFWAPEPAARRPQLSIDISCQQGAQQQTCRPPLLMSIDGTDRQVDGRSPDRYIGLAPHAMPETSINK